MSGDCPPGEHIPFGVLELDASRGRVPGNAVDEANLVQGLRDALRVEHDLECRAEPGPYQLPVVATLQDKHVRPLAARFQVQERILQHREGEEGNLAVASQRSANEQRLRVGRIGEVTHQVEVAVRVLRAGIGQDRIEPPPTHGILGDGVHD